MAFFHSVIRYLVVECGWPKVLFQRLCDPSLVEWTDYLRKHGNLHSIGEDVFIHKDVMFPDPEFVKIGSNVWIASGCCFIAHNGVIGMLNKAYHEALDDYGKIDIKDNVYIGQKAIILPNVTIGPNAIVGAGAVVTRDVHPGSVVTGSPARMIGDVDTMVSRLKESTAQLPWKDLIYKRGESSYDPEMEEELKRIRLKTFWGE